MLQYYHQAVAVLLDSRANAEINFEDVDEYMQNYHTQNNIPFNKGKKLIGSYFGKEILLYSPFFLFSLSMIYS